ncbi:MAG: transcriptional regulator [Paenibacillaceae bacterium]|jgi:two-component system response regulator ResD|nr:transcriptional regulator [Paenibacillaceae bacterium]
MTNRKVLVIDDEWNMRNLLRIYLRKEGYEVTEAASGREGLERIGSTSFDLILLDVMMPDQDGWQVMEKLRALTAAPVLMLTARAETKDKVQGLGLGADDYVTKPFEPEELIARVHALIRRSALTGADLPKLEFPGLVIYPESRQVLIHGRTVDFTPKEFDMLTVFAQNPQRAYTRETLVELMWGNDYQGETRVIDFHVKNIREKVQKAGLAYNPIQTVWGVGYKFDAAGASV